jgi:plasmid stabilization system protein ParE
MTYELFLVPRAEADVDRIIRFLNERSPQGAAAWSERWLQVVADLRANPLQHGLAPESTAHSTEVRQVFKTRRGRIYRALYAIAGRGIYIIHVRGPRQNLVSKGKSPRRQ